MVSYDAINLMRPWSYDPAWGGRAAWCMCSRSLASSWRKLIEADASAVHTDHTDQPATLPQEQIEQEIEEKGGAMAHGFERLYCQGFVNLLATSEATGGNVVVPKSHRHWERLATMAEGEEADYRASVVSWGPDHPQYKEGVQCHLEAGDLFLWDSRAMVRSSDARPAAAADIAPADNSTATGPPPTRRRRRPRTSSRAPRSTSAWRPRPAPPPRRWPGAARR